MTGFVDNADCYLTSTAGSIDDAAVGGDYIYGMKGASAVDTPSTGLAEVELNYPSVKDAADNSLTEFVSAGSTLSVTTALHNGKTIKLDTATGSVCTLPAATGSGAVFKFVISVLATSNSHIVKVANSSDTMVGLVSTVSDDSAAVKGFVASGTGDTITLNRTTTGSVALGEELILVDFTTNKWHVRGMTASTGTEATPFSATV